MSEAQSSLGITTDEFNLWRHHPVSKIFFQYLSDWGVQLGKATLDDWISGALVLSEEQQRRGRLIAIAEIEALTQESIRHFYFGDERSEEEKESDKRDSY